MKIAFTACWHARGKDVDIFAQNVGPAFVNKCREFEVDVVCHDGDVFDRPTIGDNHASTGAVAKSVLDVFKSLSALGITSYAVPGNHDYSGAGSADALHVLEGIPNVTVFRLPGSYIIKDYNGNTLRAIALPWMWGQHYTPIEKINSLLTVMDQQHNFLFGHVQVVGGVMGSRFNCEEKQGSWQISRKDAESLPLRKVSFGDFHKRQSFNEKCGYVGALRQLNFGESKNPCGFEVWNSETNLTQWIELPSVPHYHAIEAKPGDDIPEPPPGDLMRVRFDSEPTSTEAKILEGRGVRVECLVEVSERTSRAIIPDGIALDDNKLIHLFAETQNPPITGDRLTNMVSVFHEINSDEGAL